MKIIIKDNLITKFIHLVKPMPNFTKTFAEDLKYLVTKIKSNKGSEFHLANDLGFVMVYYAIELCFTFQKKGNGTITSEIKNKIITQTISASELNYRTDNNFKKTIREKFDNIIENDFIVKEAIEYLNGVRNS